jgi:polysaccharide pyruvyl transferase WcaK-like protein
MAIENRAVLALEERALRRRIARLRPQADEAPGHVLLMAPGNGNIGDQALLESFVRGVDGPVTLVVRRPGDVADLPADRAEQVRVVALPDILYGLPWKAVGAGVDFARLLRGALSFSVVGADIMDGVYWEAPSIRRFRLARLAAEQGIPSRVLGFSWSAHPTGLARAEMVRASRTVELCVRDTVSAQRLHADGAERLTEVADLAFQIARAPLPDDLGTWVRARQEEGRGIVILNSNGLLEARTSTVEAYRDAIARHRELAFVALPHTSRGAPSDLELALALGRLVDDRRRLHVVHGLLTPGQVAELAAQATLVVSGRMHLTILATTVGTPALTIGYQGKVAGLYDALGTDTWIDVDANTPERLLALLDDALARGAELRAAVAEALPLLRDRSRRNLDGLRGGATSTPR